MKEINKKNKESEFSKKMRDHMHDVRKKLGGVDYHLDQIKKPLVKEESKEIQESNFKVGSRIRYGVETAEKIRGRPVIMSRNAKIQSVTDTEVITHNGVKLAHDKKVASRGNLEKHLDWHVIKEEKEVKYPDSETGAINALKDMSTHKLDGATAEPHPARGTWIVKHKKGKSVVYLGGHGSNHTDDFEDVDAKHIKEEASSADLIKAFHAKGGKVTKGETKPMDDNLKYKRRVNAAGVHRDAMKDPAAAEEHKRKTAAKAVHAKKVEYMTKSLERKNIHVEKVPTPENKNKQHYKFSSKDETGEKSIHDHETEVMNHLKTHGINGTAIHAGHDGKNVHVKVSIHENTNLEEGMKLIATHTNKNKTAKVYHDSEWEEYRVKHYTDGKHHADADYHTDDKADANDTAKQHIKEEVQIDEISKEKLQKYVDKAKPQASGWGAKPTEKSFKRSMGVIKAEDKIEDKTPVKNPKVHDLRHMKHDGEVYDHTQTHEHIKDGDVLHLHGNRSAVLYKAWPTMIHGKSEHLHHPKTDGDLGPRYKESTDKAKSIVKGMKEEMENFEEGKTWKADDETDYAGKKALRDRVKSFAKNRKDAKARKTIDDSPIKEGYPEVRTLNLKKS